ncbi:MAG: DUF2007 domain-containing protein [bacterium]|nr:DUF2007 domain-containing protein [bacterium]
MYCPCCKSEYRVGITHCSDCDVDLVEQLPEEDENTSEVMHTETNGRLKKLLTVEDHVEADLIVNLLKNNGILCLKQDTDTNSYMKLYRGTSIYGEDLYVNEADYEEAKRYCEEVFLKHMGEEEQDNQEQTKKELPTISNRYVKFLSRLTLGLALGSILLIVFIKVILIII